MWLHIVGNDGAGADEAVVTELVAADDGGVGSNGGALPHSGWQELGLPFHVRAWMVDVGEDATWTQKRIVFDDDTGVDGDVVLDLHASTQTNPRR